MTTSKKLCIGRKHSIRSKVRRGNIRPFYGVTNMMIAHKLHKRREKYVNLLMLFILMTIPSLSSLSAQVLPDSIHLLPDVIFFGEGAGFIPFRESYRINYHTSLAGIPFEFAGGICFPVNTSLSAMFGFRYKRRTAVYVPDLRIKTLEIELGARDYLEKEHENDLRLYGNAGLLLARATTIGTIEATSDGTNPRTTEVSKDYFNIGLGLGLGVEYPLTKISAINFGIHIGVYFADATATGGLGNIGGLSIELGYRLALW